MFQKLIKSSSKYTAALSSTVTLKLTTSKVDFAMALFQSARKCSQTLGIYARPQSNQNSLQLNWRNSFFLMWHFELIAVSMAYTIAKAEVIGEYADSILVSLNFSSSLFYLLSTIYKIPKILDLIGEFEQFIEKSKFTSKIIIHQIV